MNLFCVCSGKGGTGKTLVSINLAFACAEFSNVKLIETDMLTPNMRFYLELPKKNCLNDALNGKKKPKETEIALKENLKIVQAAYDANPFKKIDHEKINKIIKEIAEENGTVFIDLPPGLNEDVIALLREFKSAIIVTNPEMGAVSDARKLVEICSELKAEVKGVIINRVGRFKEELKESEIASIFEGSKIIGKIPEDQKIPEAAHYGKPVTEKFPDSEAAKEFFRIAKELHKL
ncbi:MAG TPA: P-loop NTPase [archaeon]|nr:P-loop NTPase [archaeon]